MLLQHAESLSRLKQEWLDKKNKAARSGRDAALLSCDDCVQLLLRVALEKPLILAVDGLDETDEQRVVLLNTLRQISNEAEQTVKLVLASRPLFGVNETDSNNF